MCIAIYNPPGIYLKKWAFDNCWDNNKDGGGILFTENGKLKSYKQLRDKDTFFEKYRELRSKYPGNMVLHFRRANYGSVTLENCHPFIHDDIGFVHNGTIWPCLPGKKSKSSDTKIFGRKILRHIRLLDLDNPIFNELISYYIGSSKLIVMDSRGEISIVNENLGEWNSKMWFSNDSYLKLRNKFDRDYGYCRKCDIRLFGTLEEDRRVCNGCQDKGNV